MGPVTAAAVAVTAFDRLLDRLRAEGRKVSEARPGQAMAQCPSHDDGRPSLSLRRVEGQVLLHCFAGCETEQVLDALGLQARDLFDSPSGASYHYTDQAGTVLRTVTRTPDKRFRQAGQPKGPSTLYRLPEVVAAVAAGRTVWLAEGEKDVHALESAGVVATTAPMGAANWDKVDSSPLHGARVVAVVDRDEAGRGWARAVQATLAEHGTSLEFRQARMGKDAADHLTAGYQLEDMEPLALDPAPAQGQTQDPREQIHERLVHDELRSLRARTEARRLFAEEQRGPLEPFDAGTLAEVLARPPQPASRVEGLIPWSAGTLLTAQRKAGKTTALLNLARSLLTGQDFLGRFGVRPVSGDVALLNFEVSAGQLAQWADEVGVNRDRLFLVNLRGRRNPLGSEEDRARLAALLRGRGVETLVCDPFGRAYTGTSQNDAGEVGAFLTALDLFARTEVGALDLVLTAHAGWNGERTRGSTALEDWADSIITMTRDDSEDGAGSRYLRAIGRDVDVDEDRLAFDQDTRLLTLAGAGSRKAASSERKASELQGVILAVVAAQPGIHGAGVEAQLRADGVTFQRGQDRTALRMLVESGRLRREDGDRNKRLYYPAAPAAPAHPSGEPGEPPQPPYIWGGSYGGGSETSAAPICRVCSEPMVIVEPGQTTHPGCESEEA